MQTIWECSLYTNLGSQCHGDAVALQSSLPWPRWVKRKDGRTWQFEENGGKPMLHWKGCLTIAVLNLPFHSWTTERNESLVHLFLKLGKATTCVSLLVVWFRLVHGVLFCPIFPLWAYLFLQGSMDSSVDTNLVQLILKGAQGCVHQQLGLGGELQCQVILQCKGWKMQPSNGGHIVPWQSKASQNIAGTEQ